MRVIVSLSDLKVIQVEKKPEINSPTPINGKFVLPIPQGADVEVGPSSYVYPVDGGDISSLAQANLLAQFPQYGNIAFNPLLTASDVADLDLAATGPNGEKTRAQTGRGVGPLVLGQAPGATAILPQNEAVTPARPGCLVTNTIDISSATGGVGANDFMVWWYIYAQSTSHDITSDYGATSGINSPAIKSIMEIDQEPGDFEVWFSADDGLNYIQVGRLEPIGLCTMGTKLRLAFLNKNPTEKRYLAAYSILF